MCHNKQGGDCAQMVQLFIWLNGRKHRLRYTHELLTASLWKKLLRFFFCSCRIEDNYRPQRSCGKVMFSQACVILFRGGVCLSACWDTPREQTPQSRHAPGSRHPPGAEHAGRYGQRAGGTHPTGMQSCCIYHVKSETGIVMLKNPVLPTWLDINHRYQLSPMT